MPLLLRVDGVSSLHPLASSTLVGRHWSCGVRVDAPRLPAFWLELRWDGDVWRWRELAGGGVTRGAGAEAEGGWRPFGARGISWDSQLAIALAEPIAPAEGLLDLVDGAWLTGAALADWLESADGARWAPVEEGSPTRRLVDGDVFATRGRAWRYHAGTSVSETARETFHLGHREVTVELAAGRRRAVVRCGQREVTVHGECVRILTAYAIARRRGDGWLTRTEAHDAWCSLGGRADSCIERLGWERGKLRTQLAEQGVLGVRELFETQIVEGVFETRLALRPEQLLGE